MKRKFKQKLDKYCRRYPKLFARLLGEYPFVDIKNRLRTKEISGYKIPFNVYMTWEELKLGKTHSQYINRFMEDNPEFSFYFYDRNMRDCYMNEIWGSHPIYHIYKNAKFGAMQVDIWRMCVLYDKGGFYFDINKMLTLPILTFLEPSTEYLISYDPEPAMIWPKHEIVHLLHFPELTFCSWGFASIPGHAIPKRMIDCIIEYYPEVKSKIQDNPPQAIIKFTGPRMLTRAIWDVLLENNRVHFTQVGIQFNMNSISNIPRSWVRYVVSPTYFNAKNCIIVD